MRVLSHPRAVPPAGTSCRAAGFTLVELMITIAVAAILLMIAVPSFNNIINSNRLTTAANTMVNALNTARMEAIKRNGSVQFCSNSASTNTSGSGDTLGSNCGTSAGAVYAGTSTTPVLAAPPGLGTTSVQIHGTVAAIRFNGEGLGYAPGSTTPFDSGTLGAVVDLCSKALSSNNHIQVSMATGTIITSGTPFTGTCP
ncbi:GspH/FimT family pseudopilin [Dyella agri]|uniref:Type II secretion system protein H n=1 Tax=Dyella agri TaxID=1926869 RepID=A0ABW8KFQ6_9GAMM